MTSSSTSSESKLSLLCEVVYDIFVSTVATPSPTGLVDQSSAGAIAAGVLVPVVVLGLLAATAVVVVVIYRKGMYLRTVGGCGLCNLVFFFTYFQDC